MERVGVGEGRGVTEREKVGSSSIGLRGEVGAGDKIF